MIKAKDARLPLISVATPGFLTIGPIPKGVFEVTLLAQHTAGEATPSQPIIKEEEEEEVVNLSDFENNFEVFNLSSPLEVLAGELSVLPPTQVSYSQGDLTIPKAMLI